MKDNINTLDREFYTAYMAIFFLAVGLSFFIIIFLLRTGIPTPILGTTTLWVFLAAILFTPFFIPASNNNNFLVKRSIVSILVITSPVLGFYAEELLVPVYSLLAIAGLYKAYPQLKLTKWKHIAFLLIIAPIMAMYVFVEMNYVVYANPLANEVGMLGGPSPGRWAMSQDIYFHTAIANMIQHYGIASLGIDGLVPIKYHYASHLWMASLALITGMDVIYLYSFSLIVIIIPTLFYALFMFASVMNGFRPKLALVYILLLLCILWYVDNIGRTWVYMGESFLLSMAVALLAYPIVLSTIREKKQNNIKAYSSYALILFVTFMLFGLKVSTGLIWATSVGFLIIRHHWKSIPHYTYMTGLFIVVLFGFFQFNPVLDLGTNGNILVEEKFFQLNAFQIIIDRPAWFSITFLVTLMTMLLAYSKTRCSSDGNLILGGKNSLRKSYIYAEVIFVVIVWSFFPPLYWDWAKNPDNFTALSMLIPISVLFYILCKKLFTFDPSVINDQLELLIVIALLGFAPVILGLINGYNERWFTLFLQWIAIPYLIVSLASEKTISIFKTWIKRRKHTSIFVLLLVIFPILYITKGTFSFFHPNNEAYKLGSIHVAMHIITKAIKHDHPSSQIDEQKIEKEMYDNILSGNGFFTEKTLNSINNSPISKIREIVNSINIKNDYTIFVPPENTDFWKKDESACMANSWLIPALVGKSMLFGLPPIDLDCQLPHTYGFNDYTKESMSRSLTTGDICRHANHKDFNFVLVLNSLSTPSKNEMLDCS